MQGQCQICKGMFEIQPEWIGQQAECPHCKQTIVVQAVQSQIPQMNAQQNSNVQQNYIGQPITNQDQTMSSSNNNKNKSMGALICGIISLIMWLIPIIGLPLSIVGLILGCKNKYKVGITLNIIGLVLTIINATVGAVLGAQGKLF